ncbi:MAG: M55 family metallopeptidase [Chloroflexota bacterium]|nr:M55 family metallopeptidase [Chloroflexia bacterium]MDQ3467148.1 M55 family metallopeptidase [Chloroflexota bacterium]
MKVLISADMEGTCGVTSWVQVMPPEYGGGHEPASTVEYERARARLTREVNAAIEGALAGGADEVIVNESHDGMRNLLPEELHPDCRFITGNDKPLGMMQGVDLPGIGAIFFTGYHAKAGTPGGPLAHTWTGWLSDVRFDGKSTGEFGINAAVAGYFGVPVTLVTGDEKAVAQTRALLGEQVIGVAVKEGYSTFAALHLHPATAQALIRRGAEAAVRSAGDAKIWKLPANCQVELEFDHQTRADQAAMVPTVERAGERVIAFQPADGLVFIQTFRAAMKAASVSMSP